MEQIEIVIIGAGMAGLSCAQVLQQAGYQVVVVEKSRGVGGRLATRRSHDTSIDHGTCYLSPRNDLFQKFISHLVEAGIVHVWTDSVYELLPDGSLRMSLERFPRYVAAAGMSAIAKTLTPGLDIRLNQRVTHITTSAQQTWQLTLENPQSDPANSPSTKLEAKALVITVPAPQALDLLAPLADSALDDQFIRQLRSVDFIPCIAVMAGYPLECLQDWQEKYGDVKAIASQYAPLAWIGVDSSKRRAPSQPVLVVQSTAEFAQTVLDMGDLMPVGRSLLQTAADALAPWLATPDWMQVHRWRYAFPSHPLPNQHLTADSELPLVCTGDWCGGMRVESAFLSGLEAASQLSQRLRNQGITPSCFWQAIAPLE
ncbi:putative NAD/FAD-dependent oxidoreductase [Leptolyngbyaceae cyanobacterium JSC-12]|nr:putative NAD/FAD-dependent oxidoreductase [Leptolyngbyaceae cyanobacterium JSC-12]